MKNHVLFTASSDVIAACLPLNKLGIDGFIFMRRFPDGRFVDLSNQLDWSEDFLSRYLEGKVDVGNAQDHMLIRPGISLWSHNPDNKIWIEGRSDWGFRSGISIAKEGPDWTDIFCFYSRKPPSEMDQVYLRQFQQLDAFSLRFVDHFHRRIQEGSQNPLQTPDLYLGKNEECDELFDAPSSGFVEDLSSRELECIFYLAKGNTAEEVGKLLYISRRTVESHLRNARDKLGLHRTSELVKRYPQW